MQHLNSTINESLIKKWSPLINVGGKISSPIIKSNLARVLENTKLDLGRNSGVISEHTGSPVGNAIAAGATNTGLGMPQLVLPVLRRIFPELIAHELVGVQAMNGPIGFVLALRARLNGGNGWVGIGGDPSQNEIGYGPIDASYTGTFDSDTRVDSTFTDTFTNSSPVNVTPGAAVEGAMTDKYGNPIVGKDAGQLYGAITAWTGSTGIPHGDDGDISAGVSETARHAQNQHGFNNAPSFNDAKFNPTNRALGVGAPNTPAVQFADIIHGTYPTVNFGLERKEVVAKTRKLGAHWSPELAEDMEVMHNIDVETELVNMLSYEIGAEIDRQILTEMIKLATVNGIESISAGDIQGWDQASRVIALLSKVNYIANEIALRTRRGSGNFVVASPKICSLLTMLGVAKYTAAGESMPSVPASSVGALQKVGLINDGQQLLVRDTYAAVDYFMVGYKGNHPGDSGIIYAPYIPVQLSKILRPDTFTPQLGARTRYGVVSNPLDGSAYYKLVIVEHADNMFMGANVSVGN